MTVYRSPALALPSTSHRDALSSSGRLLAPPPPSAAALFALAGGYATVPPEFLATYGKPGYTSSSSHIRSPVHVTSASSRNPLRGHSRSPVATSSRGRNRMPSRSRSPSPVYRTKLLGRTPPPPSPSPPRRYGHVSHSVGSDDDSPPRRRHNASPSPYSRVQGGGGYSSSVSPPPRSSVYQSSSAAAAAAAAATARWSRSRSRSQTPPVRKKIKREPMTPPAAYRLDHSSHRSGSSSSSPVRGRSRSLSGRRSHSPHVGSSRVSTLKRGGSSHRNDRLDSAKYSRNEAATSSSTSRHAVKSPPPAADRWSPEVRRTERSAPERTSTSHESLPRNGGASHSTAPSRGSPSHRSGNRRH